MDEHVPSVVTAALPGHGINVLTVQDEGLLGEGDAALLDRAADLGRVVFTRDTDFLRLAQSRQRDGIDFGGVIYAHQLRVQIGQCVDELELLASVCDPEDLKNRVEYLPLK
jgi:hypothetical protein